MKEKIDETYNKPSKLVYALQNKLCEFSEKPIILCLGSEKIIADSLGPLVGHLLTTKYNIDTVVYGKLGRAIYKQNIDAYYNHIIKTHKNQKILVIDASIGSFLDFGTIQIKKQGVYTKANEFVTPLGDLSITGVVLPNGFYGKTLLKQTKLHFVFSLAEQIAYIVFHACKMTY